MSDLKQDVAYAIRTLRKSGWFAVTAVVTLALGIGANTAIFSVISGVILRPQPYRDSDRLVFLWSTSQAFPREALTPGRLVDFREQLTTVSGVAGISQIPLNLTAAAIPSGCAGSSVSSIFLRRARHAGAPRRSLSCRTRGRSRRRAEPRALDAPVCRRPLDRRTADHAERHRAHRRGGHAAGVRLADGHGRIPATAPDPSSGFPAPPATSPARRSTRPTSRRTGASGYLRAVARLKDGVTIEQARLEAQAIANRLAQQYPADDGGRGATFMGLDDSSSATCASRWRCCSAP